MERLKIEDKRMDSRNTDRNTSCIHHHGVLKVDRISTKSRIAFDSSTKNLEKISLNSNLLSGAKDN